MFPHFPSNPQPQTQPTAPEFDLSQSGLPAPSWEGLFTQGLRYLIAVAAIAAFLGIIYSGYLMITSGGDAAVMAKAKANLTWAIAGFLVAIFAYVIVRFVFGVGAFLQQ